MDGPILEQEVVQVCQRLCERYALSQAYVAEIVGRRRHYVAGYGRPAQDKPRQVRLSENVALFWHGNIPSGAIEGCVRSLHKLAHRLENEMVSKRKNRQTPHGQASI